MWKKPFAIVVLIIGGLILLHSIALAVSKPYRDIVPRWLGGLAANITVTAVPETGLGPPTGFTATYVSDNVVELAWNVGYLADNTTILAKMGEYPNDITDGYVVYNGTGVSTNDTSINFDTFLGIVKYRAWSENITGSYSSEHADAELESPHVSTIAMLLSLLWPIPILLGVVVLGAFMRAGLIVMLSGFGFMIFGFTMWTTLSWLSIILVIVGIILIAQGARN